MSKTDVSGVLVGRLDMIAEVEGAMHGLLHWQRKTLGAYASLPLYMKQVAVSDHERAYSLLARENGIELKGVMLDVLQKKVPGAKKKDGSRAKSSGWWPLDRKRLSVGVRGRQQFVQGFKYIAREITEMHEQYGIDSGGWPRNTKNCVRWNRLCPFYDVCRMGKFFDDDWETRSPDYVDEIQAKSDVMVLNVSRMECWRTCPELYRQRYVENKQPVSVSTKAVDFGTAVHDALAVWHGPSEEDEGKSEWLPCFEDERAIQAFRESIPDDHDEDVKEVESSGYGEMLLKRYFERWKEMDKKQIVRVLGVERTFTMEVR